MFSKSVYCCKKILFVAEMSQVYHVNLAEPGEILIAHNILRLEQLRQQVMMELTLHDY